MTSSDVPITADALVVIRAEELERRTGLRDPHSGFFITDAGRKMAAMAQRLDRMYVPYNLARFRHFADAMVEAAERFGQILVLGAGYDTRPLWLPGLAGSRAAIFEVDFPATIDSKRAVLAQYAVEWPANVHSVGANLGDDDLFNRLEDAGYDAEQPAALFMEGVIFFLPRETSARLLDPRVAGLVKGSFVMFDYWSAERTGRLNKAVSAATGRPLFGSFPYADRPDALATILGANGYEVSEIRPLGEIADTLWPGEDHADPLGDWYVVRATVA